MRHLIKIFLFTLMLVLSPTSVTAQEASSIYGSLSIVNRNKTEKPSKGRRTPTAPIAYTISQEDGLQIMSASISAEDIIEFEICDIESSDCIFSFPDESTFIETLFTINGEYQIRLTTSSYELIGYISL